MVDVFGLAELAAILSEWLTGRSGAGSDLSPDLGEAEAR
jgi:hypothetical protein